MLRVEPVAEDRFVLRCDRCGNEHPHPVSTAAALELEGSACFVCETDPAELAHALDVADAIEHVWSDRN